MNSKYRYQKAGVKLMLMSLFLGFVACTMEDPLTVIPAKSLEQYKVETDSLLSHEKAKVLAARVGYNKGNLKSVGDSTTTKTAYLNILTAGQVILAKADLKIAEVAAVNKSLSTPGKAFWAATWMTDRRVLNDSIIAATALKTATLQGNGAGQALADAYTAFSAVITAASSTRSSSVSSDLQITTAIANLAKAKAAFVAAIIPATIDAYVTRSKEYISAQKTLVDGSVAGYNKGEYNVTVRTNYSTALTAASAVAEKSGVTYDELSAALTTLIVPRTAFVPLISDRRSLNDSIVVATALNTATTVGTAPGQVAQAAKTTFTTAITTATTARDLPATTDGQSKATAYKLSQAMVVFRNSIIK